MKKVLLTVLCLILLVGCVTSPTQYQFTKMASGEVMAFMLATNKLSTATQWSVTSPVPYAVPTSKWVESNISPHLLTYYFENDLSTWILGVNDCVKFSTHAVSESYTVYFHDRERLSLTTLAVGFFDYSRTTIHGLEGHEIIFFIVNDKDGKGFQLKFYEPQRQMFVTLSKEELLSCYQWRM